MILSTSLSLFRRISLASSLLLPLATLTSMPAYAQTAGTASVQGTVTDPTGAVVPSAKVSLTNTETGTSRDTVTDKAGLYSMPNVPVGPYTLAVTASGFGGFTQRGTLEVGNNIEINAALKLGSGSESVEVQATGAALESETTSFKQVIDQERITELPLNGRQATQLILISGGAVNAPTNDLTGSKTYFSSTAIAVAGSQGNYNNYVLDGGTNVDTFTNTNLPYPFPDALREFSVESNSLPARNGIHPGSLVNVVTNSGTNKFHGSAFEFIRNNIINATNFFSTAQDTVKRNQFGGTLGGRILTDKLFFFGGYQNTINKQVGNATHYCLPTPAELAGDFSGQTAPGSTCPAARIGTTNGVLNSLVNPANGALINTDPTKPNFRKVDPSTYSPQALALVKYLPLSQEDAFGQVSVALPGNFNEQQYIGRVDYTLNAKNTLFGRYFLANYQQPAYYSPTNLLLTTVAGNDERVQNFTLGETFIISPRLVNTFHGTYARRRDTRGPTAGGINATTVGANLFVYVPADLRLTVSGGPSVGCGTCSPGFFNTNTEDFSDDIDYLRGKHQIAFGGEIIRTGDNTQSGYLQNGSFTFNGQLSGARNGNVGEGMIDFLTGQMQAFSQSRAQQTTYRQTIVSAYAQDTYHLTPHVTAILGLRYEPMLYPVDKFGRGSTFNQAAFTANQHSTKFPLGPAGSFYYGDAGVPKSFTDNRLANFSPRAGFTIDPYGTGKTVFRFGGAIMYDSPGLFETQRLTSNPPYTDEIDLTGQISFARPWGTSDPFPGVFPPDATAPFFPNTLYVVMPRHIQTPTVNQWTASLQQDLGRGWNMSINYLGNKNSHLWLGAGFNPAVYIPGVSTGANGSCGPLTTTTGLPKAGTACSTTGNTNARTLLSMQNYSQGSLYSPTMTTVYDGANSSYNGVIFAAQHRMTNNFSFLANYTWSHCISIGDAPGDVAAPVFENSYNTRLDRGNCGFDVRHIFNTTLVARSQFRSLPRYARTVVNGWEIAPLVRVLSGVPLNITSGIDNSLTGQGLDRPNLANPNAIYTGRKIRSTAAGNRAFINFSAFTQNAPGTYGNLGRNALRQPNFYDVDTSITRTFSVFENVNLNLRLEAFNILNHPNLNAFTTSLNSTSTFGNATGAADPRIFQAAGKITF